MRLTDRDRQLMGILATARMLSTEQIGRLMYPGRSEFNLKKRLRALAGIRRQKDGHAHREGRPFLKRQTYRTWEGRLKSAWMPTELGYIAAESVLPEAPTMPRSEVGAAFIEHQLLLNEVYVQLLEAPLKAALFNARVAAPKEKDPEQAYERMKAAIYAKAATPGLSWHTSDTVRLPWTEWGTGAGERPPHRRGVRPKVEPGYGKGRKRLILPDAVLEFPGRRQRYFLEAETGSHSLAAQSDEKRGTTLAKLNSYLEYTVGAAYRGKDGRDVTHYRCAYPDDFEPRVLFVVRSEARLQSLERTIESWRSRASDRCIWAHALTIEKAAADFLSRMGYEAEAPAPAPRAKRELVSGEVRLAIAFCNDAVAAARAARARARQRNEPMPPYPRGWEAIGVLLDRLSDGTGEQVNWTARPAGT